MHLKGAEFGQNTQKRVFLRKLSKGDLTKCTKE